MTTKKEESESPDGPTVSGEHDISDHPAIQGGCFKNVGDTVLSRDPSALPYRRPILEEQRVGERKTTTSDPAKKTVKAATKGDGAGPES